MQQYLDLLLDVFKNGTMREGRNGATISVFGRHARFNLQDGFPLLTTKKLHFHSILTELLWFLSGSTNVGYLKKNKVRIWDEWANPNGEVGPIYGFQWRRWTSSGPEYGEYDQIKTLIQNLRNEPYSRRHIVSAWNVADLPKMSLPPCPCFLQFYVGEGNLLSCHVYQRSGDIFLGVPFDIASYATLTMMIARVCELGLGELIFSYGDLHLYETHIPQAAKQLRRPPGKLPELIISGGIRDIDEFTHRDFILAAYHACPHIPAKVVV